MPTAPALTGRLVMLSEKHRDQPRTAEGQRHGGDPGGTTGAAPRPTRAVLHAAPSWGNADVPFSCRL